MDSSDTGARQAPLFIRAAVEYLEREHGLFRGRLPEHVDLTAQATHARFDLLKSLWDAACVFYRGPGEDPEPLRAVMAGGQLRLAPETESRLVGDLHPEGAELPLEFTERLKPAAPGTFVRFGPTEQELANVEAQPGAFLQYHEHLEYVSPTEPERALEEAFDKLLDTATAMTRRSAARGAENEALKAEVERLHRENHQIAQQEIGIQAALRLNAALHSENERLNRVCARITSRLLEELREGCGIDGEDLYDLLDAVGVIHKEPYNPEDPRHDDVQVDGETPEPGAEIWVLTDDAKRWEVMS